MGVLTILLLLSAGMVLIACSLPWPKRYGHRIARVLALVAGCLALMMVVSFGT